MRMMKCKSGECSKGKRFIHINNNHDAVRIYRGIIESATKLDSRECDANSFADLFSNGVNQLRQKLREQCLAILLSSPIEYGRRVEDILWRKSYHNVMQYYKKWKKKMSSNDISLLVIHFTSGIGHYNNLMLEMSKHYKMSLRKIVPYSIPFGKIDDCSEVTRELPCDEEIEWCQQAIHRILIYMGDLARYLHDIGQKTFHDVAIRFYDSALIWDPEIGMPFNQIGTLSDSANYGLDSAYYYLRCMTCVKPFDGAENNLKRIFQNNESHTEQFKKELINVSDESFHVTKRAFCLFLKFCNDIWYMKPSETSESTSAPFVQDVLYSLKSAFNLKPKISTLQMPTHLSPIAAFEIGVISLIIIERTKGNENVDVTINSHLSLAITFAFTCMMYAVDSCHRNLQTKLGIDGNKTNGMLNFSPGMSKENTPELSPRRALSRLRRRKAAINYDDGNALSLDMDNDDSDLSELEETALSTIDALEIGSDISDSEDDDDDDPKLNMTIVSSDDEPLAAKKVETVKEPNVVSPAESLLNFILNDTPLPTIKLFCDYLRVNPNYLTFIADSLKGFFEDFISFVNTLIDIEEKVILTFPKLIEFKRSGNEWIQKYPLSSDLSLSNLKIMESAFKGYIQFDCERELNYVEKAFICIESIIAFCHHIIDNSFMPKISIIFSTNDKRFKYNNFTNGTHFSLYDSNTWSDIKSDMLNNGGAISAFPEIINADNYSFDSVIPDNDEEVKRQKQVMRNMAHLWLKAEVTKLEKDVIRGGATPQLPPYLVLDSSAYEYLSLVKQLTSSKRFIVVVPKIVLAALDQQKKMSVQTRDAIRWLETEVSRGNRMIRFQKDNERLSLSPLKYPKKKDRDACDFYELLECCHYLNNNGTHKNDEKSVLNLPIVTLLTASNNKWPANSDGLAKHIGIGIETVESFVSKWQNISKSKLNQT